MKVSFFLTLITTLNVSATLYSQDVKLDVSVKDKSVIDVIRLIEKQSNYRFFFSDNYQDLNSLVSLNAQQKSITEVLSGLLDKKAITYKILENNIIVITPTDFVIQQQKITGTIIDVNTGELLPGVSIQVEGTTIGVTSDIEGKYSIEVPSPTSVLQFSSVGYLTEKMTVSGQTIIDVKLVPDIKKLDDIVVVGYGTVKRAHLTGAVSTLNSKEIEDMPVSNLGAALSGRVAGLEVSGGASRPGEVSVLKIRNPLKYSKDGGSTSPLYVIDDVIRTEEDFNILDASEIGNISILKDASASVFGARAGQGVILVKTKRGKEGKMQISYNGSVGVSDATYMPKMMNGYDFATYQNTINKTNGRLDSDASIYAPDELDYFKANNYDWLNMVWKKSTTHRHGINISGGNNKTTYFAGATYYKQDGNFDNINFNKWSFRSNVDSKLSNNLKVGLSVAGDFRTTRKYYNKVNSAAGDEADWMSSIQMPQYIPPYVDGYPVLATTTSSVTQFHLMEVQKLNNYKQDKRTGLDVNANLEYDIPFIKGLKAKVQYSRIYDNKFSKEFGTYVNLYTFSGLGTHRHIIGGTPTMRPIKNGDQLFYNPDYTNAYQLNASLSFNRNFGKHEVSMLGLFEQSENFWEEVRTTGSSIIAGGTDQLSSAYGTPSNSSSATESASLSYVGRVNYSFANKYLAEFAFRVDASTNFAPENYWGFFPSLSLGWVASEESFFRDNIRFCDYFKIRGSVGLMGGDMTKAWMWRQRYTFETNSAVFGGNNDRTYGITMGAFPNPDVQWDHTLKYNYGLDTKFLNQRLSVTFDGFFNHGYDLLATQASSTPLTIGATMPSINFAERNAFGWELSMDWKAKLSHEITYKIGGFLSWSDDKVILNDQAQGNIGTWLDQRNHSSDMGVQGYYYSGMLRTQADVDKLLSENPGYTLFGAVPQPGMLYYKDIRGPKDATGQYTGPDGIITEDDKDIISPYYDNHYVFGMNLGIGWKGLNFEAVLSGSFGGQGYTESEDRAQSTSLNRPKFWTDHWRPDNTSAAYPNPTYRDDYNVVSEFWFVNSFRFQVKTINLSYTLPEKLTKALKINSCKFILSGINPLTLYNPYNYRDPSNSVFDYPNLRTFSLGINLNF